MSLVQNFKKIFAGMSGHMHHHAPPPSGEEKLEKAKGLLADVPEGKALLDLAQQLNCPIHARKGHQDLGTYRKFPGSHVILIRANQTIQGMTETLAHELRHMWQYHHVPDLSMKRLLCSTASHLAITRVLEGDAVAFEKRMMSDISGKKAAAHETIFQDFQDSLTAALYDLAVLRQENHKRVPLKTIFNDRAFDDTPDLRKILVRGLDIQETPYITKNDGKELLADMLEISRKQPFKRALTRFVMG